MSSFIDLTSMDLFERGHEFEFYHTSVIRDYSLPTAESSKVDVSYCQNNAYIKSW